MTPAILPADPMLDVLNDAIASKLDTIAMMNAALRQAHENLAHLRQRRADLLAKAAGIEPGQVYLVRDHGRAYDARPAIVVGIRPYGANDDHDWLIDLAYADYDHMGKRRTGFIYARDWATHRFGRIDADEKLLASLSDKKADAA